MTGLSPLVQPNPSRQNFKIVIKAKQTININERFTGIMKAKGHISPFAQSVKKPEPMMIEAEEPTRSRRTSFMSEGDMNDRGGDAIDGAFKRAMKKVAPLGDFLEADEEQSVSSMGEKSQTSSIQSAGSSHVSSTVSSQAQSAISDVPSQASGTTISSIPSVRSAASLLTDITTPSERSMQTTATGITEASAITKAQNEKIKEKFEEMARAKAEELKEAEDKMELESEAGRSVMTSLSEIGSTVTSKKDSDKME